MKHLMLLLFLVIGFVPSASARPRPGRECAEVNQRRYNFGLPPDIRCTGEAYGRDYDYDRYYSQGRRYRQGLGRQVADTAVEVAAYGAIRWIDDRFDRRVYGDREDVRYSDRSSREERDYYRERSQDLERELRNRDEQYRREESRRISREKKELDKRRKELQKQNADIANRERVLAQRDARASQVMVRITNDLEFPVCIRREADGKRSFNLNLPAGHYSLVSKTDLDVLFNGYYEVAILTGNKEIPGTLLNDPSGGLRVAPIIGEE